MNSPIDRLYDSILADGQAGSDRFYAALRARGIAPTPDPARNEHNLYAPNPALLSAAVVEAMTRDANVFCRALREQTPDAASLLARAPRHVARHYASAAVADRLLADHRRANPLVCLDAFLVEGPAGLEPAYLEWQTVGTYVTMGLLMVEAAAEAWPAIASHSSLTAWPGLTLAGLADHLRALYTAGIEEDPRSGVVVDYRPDLAATRREFQAIQELTGGAERGLGIIDARELIEREGGFHYRRAGQLIPIRRVYSRLVYTDLLLLEREASADQLATIRRFYQSDRHSWISHLLHFFYGSKADFPGFWAQGLSPHLPETRVVTPELIAEWRARAGGGPLIGYVQKPLNAQSGRDVVLHPTADQLTAGAILQREIVPAACHRTLWGARTPEIRIMATPGADGELITGLVYNRIKSPEVFLSNAGSLARGSIPGTGEGFGIIVG